MKKIIIDEIKFLKNIFFDFKIFIKGEDFKFIFF